MNHQSHTNQSIFFVLEPNDELDIPIHVAFDDADTAKAYLNRFRTFSDATILECQLNPGFYTDITRDCFFILLNMYNDEASTYLVNDLHRSELAIDEYYFFEGDQICIYLMATSEEKALAAAHKIKDKAIKRQPV